MWEKLAPLMDNLFVRLLQIVIVGLWFVKKQNLQCCESRNVNCIPAKRTIESDHYSGSAEGGFDVKVGDSSQKRLHKCADKITMDDVSDMSIEVSQCIALHNFEKVRCRMANLRHFCNETLVSSQIDTSSYLDIVFICFRSIFS